MTRKNPTDNDLERGKRLKEVRKKIWKSRLDFTQSTGISHHTLEGWESRGTDISTDGLKKISEEGGDVLYILTGEKKQ